MTQIENDALICLHYGMYMPPKKMALWVVAELDSGMPTAPPLPSADTFLATLEGMVTKGWLKVVHQSAEKRRAQWIERGWLVPEEHGFADKGDLDFTRKGFALYQDRGEDRLIYVDEANRTLNCVMRRAELCEAWLASETNPLNGTLAGYVGGLVKITAYDPPEPVGKWFDREQKRHRRGWRLTIHYRPVRRRRVRFPEYQVEAWLKPKDSVWISGTVQGLRFHFSESVYGRGDHYFYTPELRIFVDGTVLDKEIHTVFEGRDVVAGYMSEGYRGTDFTWEAPARTQRMTPEEAISYLRQGIEAWGATL